MNNAIWGWPWTPAVIGILLAAIIAIAGYEIAGPYPGAAPEQACEIIIVGGSHE